MDIFFALHCSQNIRRVDTSMRFWAQVDLPSSCLSRWSHACICVYVRACVRAVLCACLPACVRACVRACVQIHALDEIVSTLCCAYGPM